jgi:hypothetical protein
MIIENRDDYIKILNPIYFSYRFCKNYRIYFENNFSISLTTLELSEYLRV